MTVLARLNEDPSTLRWCMLLLFVWTPPPIGDRKGFSWILMDTHDLSTFLRRLSIRETSPWTL